MTNSINTVFFKTVQIWPLVSPEWTRMCAVSYWTLWFDILLSRLNATPIEWNGYHRKWTGNSFGKGKIDFPFGNCSYICCAHTGDYNNCWRSFVSIMRVLCVRAYRNWWIDRPKKPIIRQNYLLPRSICCSYQSNRKELLKNGGYHRLYSRLVRMCAFHPKYR